MFGLLPCNAPPEDDGELTAVYTAAVQFPLREPSGADIQVKVLAAVPPVFLGIGFLLLPRFSSSWRSLPQLFYSLGIPS